MCGDCSISVNSQPETQRHLLPLPEELLPKLGGGLQYTKIDLADAYNQIKLCLESWKQFAVSTHRGVLLKNALPFGISSAPGYFQSIMAPFKSRVGHYRGLDISGHNSLADWPRELFKPSTDLASLLVEIEKNASFWICGFLEVTSKWGNIFAFSANFTRPWAPTQSAVFLAQAFWKLGQNSRL